MEPIPNTPVESYLVNGMAVFVKREDLCAPSPGPAFSKMRGVYTHVASRPEKVIGVLDTLHSKAGWAVSCACQALGKQCINFWPRFKRDGSILDGAPALPREQQQMAGLVFGAHMWSLPAGRSAILYHRAKRGLETIYPGVSYMMPNALKIPESVEENALEAARTELFHVSTGGRIILSVSSGTVAAGVLLGMHRLGVLRAWDVVLHAGYSRTEEAVRSYMAKAAGIDLWAHAKSVTYVDEHYGYSDKAKLVPPFPANPYYDAKAWQWTVANPAPHTLFWSIGA